MISPMLPMPLSRTAAGVSDSLLSPRFTPPRSPRGLADAVEVSHSSGAEEQRRAKVPRLLERLPNVECVVRARIPTTTGAEMFLHLYKNDVDDKEHLAIVFGHEIRSRSLDRVRSGETEMDRMIRGAYVGRLRPGRKSSRVDRLQTQDNANLTSPSPSSASTPSSGDSTPTPDEDGNLFLSAPSQMPLVRIHSECYTGETAWSARCDCGEQLDEAARLMSESTLDPLTGEGKPAPGGVIIYLRQEGRGIGLGEKLKAYNLQDLGSDTVEANLLLRHPADARSYGLATAILVDLGLGADSPQYRAKNHDGIRLLTNNPDKVSAVEGPDREVIVRERVPMVPVAWRTNGQKGIHGDEIEGYLKTKVRSFLVVTFSLTATALGFRLYWPLLTYHR